MAMIDSRHGILEVPCRSVHSIHASLPRVTTERLTHCFEIRRISCTLVEGQRHLLYSPGFCRPIPDAIVLDSGVRMKVFVP